MKDFKGMEQYKTHYLKPEVQQEICSFCLMREAAVIAPGWMHEEGAFQNGQRNLRIHEPYMVKKIHNFKLDKSETPVQWYYSLATYSNGLPFKNFLIPTQQKTFWIINHWKSMVAYDFCMDIDAPSFEYKDLALKDAQKIAKDLLSFMRRVEIRDSGKGFHIIVAYEDLPKHLQQCSFNPYHENNIYTEFKKIALRYYETHSEMIDTSIYDSRRVVKTPGSLAIYEEDIVECKILEVLENAR